MQLGTNLSFSAPVAIFRWDPNGTEPVNRDAEHGVYGTETDGVVER